MRKKIFIDGNVKATTGSLYSRDIVCYYGSVPIGCDYIKPEDGVWEIKENAGSIFDTYYVRGDVVAVGGGDIFAFRSIFELTVREYQEDWKMLRAMMELDIPPSMQALYYQQQLASAFSLLEDFLSCAFLRETCNCEDAYHRVWESGCLDRYTNKKETKGIAKGTDCLGKELLYMDAVNQIVYHNASKVKTLFKVAFGIDVDLDSLKGSLEKRHGIVHHFGRDKMGQRIIVTKEDVVLLLTEINAIVDNTAEQLIKLEKRSC